MKTEKKQKKLRFFFEDGKNLTKKTIQFVKKVNVKILTFIKS